MARFAAVSGSMLLMLLGLSAFSAPQLSAQAAEAPMEVFDNLGYGLGPGEAVIIVVPEHLVPVAPGLRTAARVTGAPAAPTALGNCNRTPLPLQAARWVIREGDGSDEDIQVAVLYPDNLVLPEGTLLGAWRPGGPCGPGYQILRGHVMVTEY